MHICMHIYQEMPRGNSTIFGAEIAREQETFLTPSANSQL